MTAHTDLLIGITLGLIGIVGLACWQMYGWRQERRIREAAYRERRSQRLAETALYGDSLLIAQTIGDRVIQAAESVHGQDSPITAGVRRHDGEIRTAERRYETWLETLKDHGS